MQVSGFTYDGKGPAVFWWGAPSADNGDIRRNGRRVVGQQLDRAYNGETVRWLIHAAAMLLPFGFKVFVSQQQAVYVQCKFKQPIPSAASLP
jgi:hypothetical protein